MNIEFGKEYLDEDGDRCVLFEQFENEYSGRFFNESHNQWEFHSYPIDHIFTETTKPTGRETWNIDDQIYVRNSIKDLWTPRHYAGEINDGRILAFKDGRSSFTSNETFEWNFAISKYDYEKQHQTI